MKYIPFVLTALVHSAGAFAPVQPSTKSSASSALEASNYKHWVAGAIAAIGITLAQPPDALAQQQFPTTVVAAELEKMDFSLPSYDNSLQNTNGFGVGSESYLGDQVDKREGEKQVDAMRKAEEARLKRVAEKKAEAKAREEEIKQRALERKKRDADRLKGIFDD